MNMIRALRRAQREGSRTEARQYLRSITIKTIRMVFERQRHTFNSCSNMLEYPYQPSAVPIRSTFARWQPMIKSEVMDEALIRLEELVGRGKYGAQTSAVIDSALAALETLGAEPSDQISIARWSTILRETLDAIGKQLRSD